MRSALLVIIALSSASLDCSSADDRAGDPAPTVPNSKLPSTLFGMDLQFGKETLPGSVEWPNDIGFDGHQVVRAWLGGGGLWADIQKNGRGQPLDWTRLDSYMQKAKRFDQRVLYVVAMTPAFAVAPERRSLLCAWPELYPGGCNPPDDWNDPAPSSCSPPADDYEGPNCTYKEFLVALVRRYRASGVQDGCPNSDPRCHGVISFYELGNEVDSFSWPGGGFWSGSAAGLHKDTAEHALFVLAHMVRDAADVIHREDPSATVVAPSFTGYDGAAYFEQFFGQSEIDPGASVDALAFHAYPGIEHEHPPEDVRDMVELYLDARARLAKSRPELAKRPLWNTEGSWGQNYTPACGGPENVCIQDAPKQTAYLTRWFLHQWDLGIETAVWFEWGDGGWGEIWCPEGKSSEDHYIGCADLTTDASQLSQAGTAYAVLTEWLRPATRSEPCVNDGITWKCRIRHPDLGEREGVIVWHDDWDGFANQVDSAEQLSDCWHLTGARGAVAESTVPTFSLPMLCY